MASSNAPSKIYQFKITLKDIKPSIWRRIQVPENYTFYQLHLAIQYSMGWSSAGHHHLHQFVMKNPQTSKKVLIGTQESPEVDNEKKIKISTYFLMNGNKSASYDYDFGDGWEHEVFLEGILPAESHINYPKCTNGMRACPPENCGGVYGYEELLEIMANPNHEEYVEKGFV